MIVGTTVLAVNFLGSNNLGGDAVSMVLLVFTVTSFDVLSVDSKELQILSFVVEIFLKVFEKWTQEPFW